MIRLLSDLGVNSFESFAVNKAKQFVAWNPDGYVIGDGILFFLDGNRVSLVGRPSAHRIASAAESVRKVISTAVSPPAGRASHAAPPRRRSRQ